MFAYWLVKKSVRNSEINMKSKYLTTDRKWTSKCWCWFQRSHSVLSMNSFYIIILSLSKPLFKVILNSMVWAEKQARRSVEQKREPRNKSTRTWANHVWQRAQKHTVAERKPFNEWCRENRRATCKRMKVDYNLLQTYQKTAAVLVLWF